MIFKQITEPEFRAYAETSPYKSFYQTPEIAKLREKSGWTAYYFGIEENGDLIAATMLVGKPTFLGKILYYAPGGPLLDLENKPLLDFFAKNLKKSLKSPLVLRIDPYYELVERDRDGLLKENGFNHKTAENNLKSLNFTPLKTPVSPKYSFVKLLDKTPENTDLMASFKRNTRNHIRKAEKLGVTVRELDKSELKIFKQITESTSKRRHFSDKPLSYYEQMYDLFAPRNEVKFVVAEAITGPEGIRSAAARGVAPAGNSSATPLSAAMFMTYGDEVIYLFSGSDEKYMKDYNAQYLIQYEMIKFAAENGYKRYNFYGINGLPDPKSKDYGIYDFKKGFTSDEDGRVTELIGTYELSLSPLYSLYKLLKKLKK